METATAPATANEREIVSFGISGQDFCIDIGHVREIRGWSATTVLPHAPEYVVGMMNLRGTVLPVIDLSRRLGLGVTEPSARHVVIIVVLEQKTIGLLVEAVSDIISVHSDDMKPTPDVASSATKNFIEGVFTDGEKMLRSLDLSQIIPPVNDAGFVAK